MSALAPFNVKEPDDTDFSTKHLAPWSGFFKKSIQERQQAVHNEANECGLLPLNIADIMIENCIGTLTLPLGISPNFVINKKHFVVPFCVEEPSIIAAASSISKLISKNGGFTTNNSETNCMIGQIQITNIHKHIHKAMDIIQQNKAKYIEKGNQKYCASMVQRGGGIIKIQSRQITPRIYKHNKVQRDSYLVLHIHIDVCDAMGANKVNTVCEGLSNIIVNDLADSGIRCASVGLRILSNLCVERMTISSFCIPIDKLSWKGVDGMVVAQKIIDAYEFAIDDVFRATTNNKGIMNGMDAVAVALGQDWRAIEAAAHCYAHMCNDGVYGPLAHYFIEYSQKKQCQCLYGYLNIPISVGSKGGCVNTHPGYKWTLNELLGELTAKDIANVIVSAGLASNFGALRALAIEGIQKGHMRLHANNIAIASLNPNEHHLIKEVSQFMILKKSIHTNMAKRYIRARNIEFESRKTTDVNPSTLIVDITTEYAPICVDVVIDTSWRFVHPKMAPIHYDLEMKMNTESKQEEHSNEDMIATLFGTSTEQIETTYRMMDGLDLCCSTGSAELTRDASVLSEIKLLSLLINKAVREYLVQYSDALYIKAICDWISCMNRDVCHKIVQQNEDKCELKWFSQCLIQSLVNGLMHRIQNNVGSNIGRCLLNWQLVSLHSLMFVSELEVTENKDGSVGECLKNVMFEQRNIFPILIFVSLNMVTRYDLKDLKQEFVAMIEKCGMLWEWNMHMTNDIMNHAKDNHSGNLYLLYLKLSQLTHAKTHIRSFRQLMKEKMAELVQEIQQLLSDKKELQQWFNLKQCLKSIQSVDYH